MVYPGYPKFVVISMPKCGTKTMNAVFKSLGYKVFDYFEILDNAKYFNAYGKGFIEFDEMARKIWLENEFDVIIEPAGIFWTEMVDLWPETKFIHLNRDFVAWKKSFEDFHKVVFDQTDGNIWTLMQSKPYLSKTFNETHEAQDGYCRNFIMTPFSNFDATGRTVVPFAERYCWSFSIDRFFRQFHAEVEMYAPKDRTLKNYTVKDQWNRLADFIGLDSSNLPEFPHTNKGENAAKFVEDIYKDTEYEKGFIKDLDDYFKQFGISISKKKENKAQRII